ncbi:ImmA/IrrE family metallo-endopeptidase [Holophaga foetida]|uniref:ImmA/IrrE family metallo-endopeptidase n=1 Tax=Holophaga foetida TaxID=35839 RepID=UPI00024742A2|nr:ImmA/IrrE family metallo-endopeptidase [Holophaga foetida]
MVRPNDSHLDPDELRAVEKRAQALLNRASAWNRFPTPVDDILSAANLTVAPSSLFDPIQLFSFLQHKAAEAKVRLTSAVKKILGLYDSSENLIHIDDTVVKTKQSFLKLHETGHHEIPYHKKLFTIFQDSETTLSPDVANLFEREANNFARFILFQGDTFSRMAADAEVGIKAPMALAKKFGASVYASTREYARTHPQPCLVYILDPVELGPGCDSHAVVRRLQASPSFAYQFAMPAETEINIAHPLWSVIPLDARKMTSPRSFQIRDKNGSQHECLAEAFKTPFNILILVHTVKEITSQTVIF